MDFSKADLEKTKNYAAAKKFRTIKHSAPLTKRFAIAIIIFCSALVLLNVGASIYFSPKAVVAREIDTIAREYYEDYFYQNIAANHTAEETKQELEHYQKTGTSNIYLRQLLLYDSGRREDASAYFEHKGYTCDRNKTYVKYYPDPPFGKENYHFDIKLVCE